MKITLIIPDELTCTSFGDPSQIALEALAARAYADGVLSEEQVRRMLKLPSCWDARNMLSRHGVWPGTTVEDALSDISMLKTMRPAKA
jgi:hypothetical protein